MNLYQRQIKPSAFMIFFTAALKGSRVGQISIRLQFADIFKRACGYIESYPQEYPQLVWMPPNLNERQKTKKPRLTWLFFEVLLSFLELVGVLWTARWRRKGNSSSQHKKCFYLRKL